MTSPIHRLGRPLLGDEPCDRRVTTLVTATTQADLLAKAGPGGSVSDVVRKIVEKYFRDAAASRRPGGRRAGKKRPPARKARAGRGGGKVRRYKDQGR